MTQGVPDTPVPFVLAVVIHVAIAALLPRMLGVTIGVGIVCLALIAAWQWPTEKSK